MKTIPYVSFNGTCEEAVEFYKSVLGGEAQLMRYSDLPNGEDYTVSDAWKPKIMHATLMFSDGTCLFFSDGWENADVTVGSNITIHLQVESEAEVHRIVDALSAGGTIDMPAQKTFWGSVYGSVVDKFGVPWGVEYELPS